MLFGNQQSISIFFTFFSFEKAAITLRLLGKDELAELKRLMGVSAEAEQVLWAEILKGQRHDWTKRVLKFGLMIFPICWYILVGYLIIFGILWLDN